MTSLLLVPYRNLHDLKNKYHALNLVCFRFLLNDSEKKYVKTNKLFMDLLFT